MLKLIQAYPDRYEIIRDEKAHPAYRCILPEEEKEEPQEQEEPQDETAAPEKENETEE